MLFLISNYPVNLNVFQNWQEIILIGMHFIYFFFLFQLSNIQTTVAQTGQTKPLDLSAPKVKENEDRSQGLSVEGVSDERIKLLERLVPIETLMEVMKLSKQEESTGKKRRCDICQKEVANMKKHMMAHTGEKPYSCRICKKNFTDSSNMKTHVMTHTGEKPYSCSICKKSFSKFSNMKRHMMIHTGEKPYSCQICKQNFIQSGNMKSI
ncbi:zinc finger protein [Wuchereria bancrofti]|uniref:Zinc finger protein n=1 Tax=Wuchereria bancrofti TaxID=6293 RepID=J9EJX0_WUCBA|nr:zinc finger protein [Wuchereria bancrofti]